MILVFLPNPALDKTALVPGFATGGTFRAPGMLALAGGKGFNFARALRTLGEDALVVAPLGGHIGALVRQLAEREGIALAAFEIDAETRTCLTVIDPGTGSVTDLNESGPALDAETWHGIAAHAAGHLPAASRLAVCGSFPPGAPDQVLRALVIAASAAGVPAMLDTYGPPLALALPARPALVKINQHEAGELLGRRIGTAAEALAAAVEIQQRGAGMVVITLGKQGAVGLDRDGRASGWRSPQVREIDPVGSGDSLFAGVAAGLARDQSLAEALRLGVAAGAANTLQAGAGVFDPAQVASLLEEAGPI